MDTRFGQRKVREVDCCFVPWGSRELDNIWVLVVNEVNLTVELGWIKEPDRQRGIVLAQHLNIRSSPADRIQHDWGASLENLAKLQHLTLALSLRVLAQHRSAAALVSLRLALLVSHRQSEEV